MSDQVSSESPLVRFDLAQHPMKHITGRIQARERPFLGYLNLRGDANNVVFVAAVGRIVGGELPIVPNTTCEAGDNTIYWLGPDEWLIVTREDCQSTMAREMRYTLRDVFFCRHRHQQRIDHRCVVRKLGMRTPFEGVPARFRRSIVRSGDVRSVAARKGADSGSADRLQQL